MKKKFINWFFNKFRPDIEDRFIADMFGDVPSALTENSMKFLLSGGKSFDQWMRVSSYALQRKLKQPNKEIGQIATAGLIFFKTLDVMINRLQTGERLLPADETATLPADTIEKDLRGVDEFFKTKPKVG